MSVRTLAIVVLLFGSAVAMAAGYFFFAFRGGTCSPHEGGSGCGFTFVLALPWIIAVGLAVPAIVLMVRRP